MHDDISIGGRVMIALGRHDESSKMARHAIMAMSAVDGGRHQNVDMKCQEAEAPRRSRRGDAADSRAAISRARISRVSAATKHGRNGC